MLNLAGKEEFMRSRLSMAFWKAITLVGLLVVIGCGASGQAGASDMSVQAKTVTSKQGATTVPRPAHVVIVIEENHAYSEIMGSSSAPYINSLASQGAVLTNSHAVTHPSEPNNL